MPFGPFLASVPMASARHRPRPVNQGHGRGKTKPPVSKKRRRK